MKLKLTENDIGKLVVVNKNEINYKGYIVEFNNEFVKLKLKDNGYNIDVVLDENTSIEITNNKINFGTIPTHQIKHNPMLPNITYIGTGGTIGTHVDYNTGGVFMCRSPEEIISTTPELESIVNIKNIESPLMKASEDMDYKDWQKISEVVFSSLENKEIDGVIITHGTDTLAWTGTAVSFMIENINKPVLLVGAQRSPDRASFDGSMNLICASHFVKEKVPGVYLVMHGSMNDDFCYVIRAVKSKKLHTSRRDAFKAINDVPIAKVFTSGKIEYLVSKDTLKIPLDKPILNASFDNKLAIIKAYPNSDPKVIDWYISNNYKALVIEGTALGHIPVMKTDSDFGKNSWIPYLKKAIDKGMIIIMCSQSMFGRVNDKVYANLRYISSIGVEYLNQHDMLPEVVFIKLGIALGRFKTNQEIINFMKTNIIGEISEKEIPKDYDYAIK